MDSYILSTAMASSEIQHPFVEKKILVLDDKSNGNYSTEVRFESSGLSSALNYINWSEGVIALPIVISCTSSDNTYDWSAAAGGLYTDYMMCLKNSYMSLIDRMTIWSGSNTCVSQVQNINQYLNFRLLTELSEDDESIWGDAMNFHVDNAASWSFNSSSSTRGNGVSNNVFGATEASSFLGIQNQYFNDGAFKRCNKFVNKADADRSALFTNTSLGAMGYDYIENLTGAKNYYLTAFIRLKDIPFFRDLPLLMGSLFKISISINQGSVKVYKSGGTDGFLMQNSNTFTSGSCCPLLFASSNIAITAPVATSAYQQNNGATYVAGGSANIPVGTSVTATLGVTKVVSSNGTTYSHPISNCRIYVPTYRFDEQVLQNYIAMGTKKHVYHNVVHSLFNVGAGNSFTQTINTRSRITRIIIVPELAQTGNGTAVATNGTLVQQKYSPFDIFPAGTAPCGAQMLSKLKIMVGGQMVWNNEVNYGWEHFLFETLNYGVNGGQSTGLTSGRIGRNDFEGEFSYIVCNVRSQSLDYSKPMQVDIAGTSLCTKDLILNCFIEYEASCEFDLTTGAMSNLVD